MNERENILGRIREALKVPSPRPSDVHAGSHARVPVNVTSAGFREWLPPVGASFEERLALFRKNAANLKADFRFTSSAAESSRLLRELCESEGWKGPVGAFRDRVGAPEFDGVTVKGRMLLAPFWLTTNT